MSAALDPEIKLWQSLTQGRYKAAERALLKGASFLDMSPSLLTEYWAMAHRHGVRHLNWMLDHAGVPTARTSWPTVLGQSWLKDHRREADWLMTQGVDVNGPTEGGGTPFVYALRAPHEPTFAWAMAHTHRELGWHAARAMPHPPFRVIFSRVYGLDRNVRLLGQDFPSPERLAAVIEARLPTAQEDPFHPLLSRSGLTADQFLMAWNQLRAVYPVDGPHRMLSPHGPTVLEGARQDAEYGGILLAWEASQERDHQLQHQIVSVSPRRRPRA